LTPQGREKTMKTTITLAMLALAVVPGPSATAALSVTTVVVQADGYKTYAYTASGYDMYWLNVWMPEPGARAVVEAAIQTTGWYLTSSFRDGLGVWSAHSSNGPASTIVFSLKTVDSVPTASAYRVDGHSSNWNWAGGWGAYSVPVPTVPEPSSLAAILAGVAGFGAVLRRRRQQ
jgi:hypothetical protein